MINLNNYRNLSNIASFFLKEITVFLHKRKEGKERLYIVNNNARVYFFTYIEKMEYRITQTNSHKLSKIWNLYKTHLPNIVNATKDEIDILAKRYEIWKESYLSNNEHALLKGIFEDFYNDFAKQIGYKLSNKINIKTCPFCNRQYTFTVNSINKKKEGVRIRPEFDHFYAKSNFPILAVSFYNLIPACPICNHVKGNNTIKIHPYISGFDCKFRIEDKSKIIVDKSNLLLLKEGQFRIALNHSLDEKTNIDVFGLKELYNQHKDYVKEIMDKTQAYDSHAREALVNSFQGAGYSPEEVYCFVWGKYLEDAEHEKRPLSKLTKDILDQLDIH
ncbi:hypothetical protein LJC57_02280 [Parabacteroides sp. OttesenSCG-928-G07]|nr:hypothetical protein [Parabacteroides sp. OttesenSCG-928-G07]